MNRRLSWLLFCAVPVWGHMMSMSTGDLTINGTAAQYELRMPLYEIAHVKNPAEALLGAIRFSSDGVSAQLGVHQCREDSATGMYICAASYTFAAPVERLDVECSFAAITVPNHVHLLRAELGGRRDQALLDLSFPRASLRFRPPTAFETFVTQAGAGFMRALGGAVQVLFLAALVLASRSRRELMALAGMFVLGEIASALIVPYTNWVPAARFVEAAAALTIAYLAVEILVLPKAGSRWLVAGALGAFHGLYFYLFLRNTDYSAALVLTGAAIAELAGVALLGFLFSRIHRVAAALRPVQVSASALLIFGMAWFFLRLRG
jgi:hypothetical protein